jgi:molybdate transport system ATP-binding protein
MAELRFAAAVADRGLRASFDVAAGEVLAILGPNGAGKSTIAGVIAGLVPADEALVQVGARVLTDSERNLTVPTHDRRVGLLLQDPLLFPHLDVLGNVMFAARTRSDRIGPDRTGPDRIGARAAALRWLDAVGVADLAGRKPRQLSGGQAQRVAIARALAAEPEVLLLDEPLAGLDVAGAAAARAVLREVMAVGGRSTVLITHDVLDVLALADRVVVREDGAITETGGVTEVLAAPRSHFGARIAGLNLVRGVLTGTGTLAAAAGQSWHGIAAEPLATGQEAVAVFSPAAVSVFREQPHGSPRNSVRGPIVGIEAAGPVVRVRLEDQSDATPGLAADISTEAMADLRLGVGDIVWLTVKAQAVLVHAAARAPS